MRLIDADALKKTIKDMPNDYYGDLCIGDALHEIDEAPTIDAVLVVRCKDCAHGRYDEDSEMYECGYVGLALYNEPNHYCSCGIKMEDKPCR